MRDECKFLLSAHDGLSYDDFIGDETLKRAFVRSLEIIGEASRNVPEEFRQENPDVEWRDMAGMRNVLIHGYFGIDYKIVWDVITNHIPLLLKNINKIIKEENM